MEYAKITLEPISPFITTLQSDTIFGHFAWGYRFCYGEDRLKAILSEFKKRPFIIFSDGFAKGYLPKPYLEPYLPKDNELKFAKAIKKMNLIDKEFIFQNIDNLSDKIIFEHLKDKKYDFKSKVNIIQKNSINRVSNRVEEGLYTIKETLLNYKFEIYFSYQDISKDEIKEVFNFISQKGYGKDKSTGKGKFKFTIDWDFSEKEYFKPSSKKDRYINLSTMLKSDNMLLLYGKTITKFAKTGGYYASSEPFKNPFIAYLPGSTFIVNGEILGRAEDRIYNRANHYQNGYSIGIYYNEASK